MIFLYKICVGVCLCLVSSTAYASNLPAAGNPAFEFTLNDTEGKAYHLAKMKDKPMVVLYFFDVTSLSSQEGLLIIDQLQQKYKDSDMQILGITRSSINAVKKFIDRAAPNFPVLLDTADVSDKYHAIKILPTVCTVGPGSKILDYYQGSGKAMEVILLRLARRQLQRKKVDMAKALTDTVVAKNPRNLEAKALQGYAALKQGQLDEARKIFLSISRKGRSGEIMGKEGVMAVYVKQNRTKEALKIAHELVEKAPQRAYAHVIIAESYYRQNKIKEAEAEYSTAIQKEEGAFPQKALAYNRFGQFTAAAGDYAAARSLYDQATEIDPYYVEATSNKGVTYEKEGQWDKALAMYQKALRLDKTDTFAAVLARKADEMLALQEDIAKKERIDKLVTQLVQRFRQQEQTVQKDEDEWTSSPMVLSFVGLNEKGLAEREGMTMVFSTQLSEWLNASGRLKVVERVVMDRLLEELNIGSSQLADPQTALKLGKVFAAQIIVTGSLYNMPSKTLLNLRMINTQTTAIAKVMTHEFQPDESFEKELRVLNRNILKTVIEQYPLKGFIVEVNNDLALINIGSNQGVVLGTIFDVIEEKKPITYKGRVLKSSPKTIGKLKISRVEPDLAYAEVLEKNRLLKQDDKLLEQLAMLNQ